MAEIIGLNGLMSQLAKMQRESLRRMHSSVVVGYTAAYALHIHENTLMKWRGLPRSGEVRLHKSGKYVTTGHRAAKAPGLFWGPTGQAKFLEQPAREMQPELARIITNVTKLTGDVTQGLLMAGLRLQRESQQKVPVLTGNLRASAFTRIEHQTE
jgi:hypothetical protein